MREPIGGEAPWGLGRKSKFQMGEHIVITRGQVPVAELAPVARPIPKPTFGSAKGMVKMSEDFDAPPEDFRNYI